MAALNRFFQKAPAIKIRHHPVTKKPAATPTFCKQNPSQAHHTETMIPLSPRHTTGNQHFASNWYKSQTQLENKVCIGDNHHKRQLLTQNPDMVYYRTNPSKPVRFGTIWPLFAKYHLWGTPPTPSLPKNTNLVSESKNSGICGF